jgi:hypothetical protein
VRRRSRGRGPARALARRPGSDQAVGRPGLVGWWGNGGASEIEWGSAASRPRRAWPPA